MSNEREKIVWQRLQEIFRIVFENPKLDIMSEWSSWDVTGWDSLMHLQLILAIEKEFGIRFKPPEMLDLKNIGELYAIILKKHSAIDGEKP